MKLKAQTKRQISQNFHKKNEYLHNSWEACNIWRLLGLFLQCYYSMYWVSILFLILLNNCIFRRSQLRVRNPAFDIAFIRRTEYPTTVSWCTVYVCTACVLLVQSAIPVCLKKSWLSPFTPFYWKRNLNTCLPTADSQWRMRAIAVIRGWQNIPAIAVFSQPLHTVTKYFILLQWFIFDCKTSIHFVECTRSHQSPYEVLNHLTDNFSIN